MTITDKEIIKEFIRYALYTSLFFGLIFGFIFSKLAENKKNKFYIAVTTTILFLFLGSSIANREYRSAFYKVECTSEYINVWYVNDERTTIENSDVESVTERIGSGRGKETWSMVIHLKNGGTFNSTENAREIINKYISQLISCKKGVFSE